MSFFQIHRTVQKEADRSLHNILEWNYRRASFAETAIQQTFNIFVLFQSRFPDFVIQRCINIFRKKFKALATRRPLRSRIFSPEIKEIRHSLEAGAWKSLHLPFHFTLCFDKLDIQTYKNIRRLSDFRLWYLYHHSIFELRM